MNKIKILSLFICAILLSVQSFAGFPIGKGRWLLVPTYTRYHSDGYYNSNREFTPYANNGRYISNYYGLYGGFGIGRDLDLVFNVPYISQSRIENGAVLESLGTVGDATIGLSYFLNHYDYYKHLAITGSLIVPLYQNTDTTINKSLIPGFQSFGLEAKIGLAGTNTESLKDTYYDIEAGFRQYFNASGPTQFFANATIGVPLDEDWKISGTLNYLYSTSTTTVSSSNSTVNVGNAFNKDFDYLRATLTVGRRLDRSFSIYGSIFTDITGRNIGQGKGYSLFLVCKF